GKNPVKIQAILVLSLVALGSSAAFAKPLLPFFDEAGPPRPPGLISRSNSYQSYPPIPRSRPGTAPAPADKPEQKTASAPPPAKRNVVTIGPSAAGPAANPGPTESSNQPSFPPVQTLQRSE